MNPDMNEVRTMAARHRTSPTILMAAVMVLAACDSSVAPTGGSPAAAATGTTDGLPALADVAMYRADPHGGNVHPGPAPAAEPQVAWQVDLGVPAHFSPILVGGLLIVGTQGPAGTAIALDARTGAERWRFQAGAPIGSIGPGAGGTSAASTNGIVYIADVERLYALDAGTGAQRWVADAPNAGGWPVVVDGVVYLGTTDGAVGFDAATGEERWRWSGPTDGASTAGPVLDGVTYVNGGDGRMHALSVADAEEHWSVLTISTQLSSSRADGDTIFAATRQGDTLEPVGELYSINRSDGQVRWRFRGPSGRGLSVGPSRDGIVYVSTQDDGIFALRDDGSKGTEVWHADAPKSTWPLVLVGETLYHQRSDASLGAYAAADGRLLWETDAPGDQAAGPIVSGGMIFDVSYGGIVRAYAEPSLIALLPEPAGASEAPSAAPSGPAIPNPFTFVRSFPWPATTIEFPQATAVGPDGLLYVLDTRPAVTVLDPADGQVVRTWGKAGSGPGEFDLTVPDDNPGKGDIAVTPDGRVYVADGTNARIQVFTPKGEFLKQFGSAGAGEGQLGTGPSEIVAASDGSIYVLADTSGPITKFTPEGKFRWRSPAPSDAESYQMGLEIAPNGDVLVTCEGCAAMIVLDPETGVVKGTFADGLVRYGAQLAPGPNSTIVGLEWNTSALLLFSGDGALLGGKYVQPDEPRTQLQRDTVWGVPVWPVPVTLGDGRAYSFNVDGLVEIEIDLST